MAQIIADRRDVDFVLHEQFEIEKVSKDEKFAEFNKKTIDLIISEARNLAVKELHPTLTVVSSSTGRGLVRSFAA